MSTISILMPVRNTGKYLPACLDSILAQSYSDWELIAIDDHSTDASKHILDSYARKDQRIQTESNVGHGIINALRTAYKISTGFYITRMDSDDLMTPNKLAAFLELLQKKGKGYLTTGLVRYISESNSGVGSGYIKYAAWLNALTKEANNYSDIYKECPIASPNWMVHKEDLDHCGAFLPNEYPEDYDLCFRFRKAGLLLAGVDAVTHIWRDYPTRTSRTDDNYADNKFSRLKVKYFLSDDYDQNKALILWGAGRKGKAIAKELVRYNIEFSWVCNNPNKLGHNIYGIILQSSTVLSATSGAQIIFAISQKGLSMDEYLSLTMQHQVYKFC